MRGAPGLRNCDCNKAVVHAARTRYAPHPTVWRRVASSMRLRIAAALESRHSKPVGEPRHDDPRTQRDLRSDELTRGDVRRGVAIRAKERDLTLILLHGAGFNSITWMGDASSWSQHFRVVAVDVTGHPGFSAPIRPAYDSEKAVAEFYALISKNFRQNLRKPTRFSDTQLARIKPTTLLLVGAKDPWMDAAEIRHRFSALVPRAQVQILAEKGHMLVGLTQQILQFLQGCDHPRRLNSRPCQARARSSSTPHRPRP